MAIEITTEIDIPKVITKIDNDKFWRFAATEWWRLYEAYVPYRDGNLYRNVTIRPKEIIHNVPYAENVYFTNKNYRTDFHAKATCRWDYKAAPIQGPKLVAAMQNYVDRELT